MKRIVRLYRSGGPEVLQLEAAEPEPPRPGEVLLRVQAIGLNNSELQYRRGDYPMRSTEFPSRLGRECSGVIEALGAGAEGFAIGDEVSTIPRFDVRRNGVYGEWAVVPVEALVRMPPRLSRIEAAAVWQQYLTAYAPLVEYASLAAGDWILVTAAASSVGRGAIQVARELGCRVVATTRSPAKAAALGAAGAARTVVTSREPLVSAVREATGGAGVKLAFDPIAGKGLGELCECAADGGLVVLYGQLDASPAELPVVTCLRKGLTVRGYTLWEITLDPVRCQRACDWILVRLADGRLTPVIDRVYSLDAIVEAHRYLDSGRQEGKVVVQVEQEAGS
ncbi:MAG TPA: zinc-dependent alcohol dehydrogenase family protein [Gaiellales bacterium]|nr:zinc-dependent alcohol dehydrogenase family protein [Gaiellales bacterium]